MVRARAHWFSHFASTVFSQRFSRIFSGRINKARLSKVSVDRFAGRTMETGLKVSQRMRATPFLAASSNKCPWILAEKLVTMMDATSSSGSFFSPSAVLQTSCPSRTESEHCGESMLTMWNDTAASETQKGYVSGARDSGKALKTAAEPSGFQETLPSSSTVTTTPRKVPRNVFTRSPD